ncbi:UDP-N-acetylglucosamine 2-epimerase [Exiguobacterium sp. s6]|uniref:UDP-N-acetylglucosamine 2-epimerase n=1 Tax=Exiguobacterium sp. s6 TaxID=2751236 RepID=UPI001BEBA9FC|nr:UDP-N-acetylglucosamine 2-epimerase [Exiguobacterium sp. s6]
MKNVLFITGTRADYGKIKTLMREVELSKDFNLSIFVTGMHMLSKYGLTWKEIEKDGFKNLYKYINQQSGSKMDIALSNTILGLSNFVHEMKPDMIVVHGDRLEALAGAIVGAFNNIKVAHIEGGEVSGTIDESIRHSITKLAHMHFVSNLESKDRICQLGENPDSVFVIGSPDIDVMLSDSLPSLEEVQRRYEINFDNYSICMFHPVTTELDKLHCHVNSLVSAMLESDQNFVVIFPNNDEGSEIILHEYKRLYNNRRIKIFPSIRFEYFLTLLNNSEYMIGNSSAGIREARVYGVSAIDIGIRQRNRYNKNSKGILHVENITTQNILNSMVEVKKEKCEVYSDFGKGDSNKKFIKVLENKKVWEYDIQKQFVDIHFREKNNV